MSHMTKNHPSLITECSFLLKLTGCNKTSTSKTIFVKPYI